MVPSLGAAEGNLEFLGSFIVRHSQHTTSPQDAASDRFGVAAEQRLKFSPQWSAVIGGRGWVEGEYASHPNEYPSTLARQDSQEFMWRDAYLQYQGDHLFVRAGNQQVVWGEAFGYLFSDIVNPKDFRDGGFGDASEVRLPTPIVNAKLIFDNVNFQALYVTQARFNLLPLPGSDFAFPFNKQVGGATVQIERQRSRPMRWQDSEVGGKAGLLIGGLDLSAYTFSYFDRNPYYQLAPSTTSSLLVLNELHSRVSTGGFTATKEIRGAVIRAEAVNTHNRLLPKLDSVTGVGTFRADEQIFVGGVDFPTWGKLNYGLQFSTSMLSNEEEGMLRPKNENLWSLHLQRSLLANQSADLIYTYAQQDFGSRLQASYMVPLGDQLEVRVGADVMEGPRSSEFGRLFRASRVYVELVSYFKGKSVHR